jgi:hypothetical protein
MVVRKLLFAVEGKASSKNNMVKLPAWPILEV